MIVAKKLLFLERFSSNFMRSVPSEFEQIPKTHFLLTCTYLRGRRHGRNLPMAKATDGLAFGITRHCRIVACRPCRRCRGGSPRGHQNPCNLQCILLMVLKNIVFYGVSGPSAFRNFILALSKNHAFYVALAFSGGPGTEKMTC